MCRPRQRARPAMPDRRRVRILTTRGAYAGGCTAGVRRDAQVGGAAGARGSTSDPYTSFGPPYVDESLTVSTDDGLKLHVEVVDAVDGVDLTPEFLPPVGVPAITLVFVHGLCLDMGTFYLQRKELARLGEWRMVFYDQPGHGRSGRLTQGEYTLDSLGRALRRVVEETSPGDPVGPVGWRRTGWPAWCRTKPPHATSPGSSPERTASAPPRPAPHWCPLWRA